MIYYNLQKEPIELILYNPEWPHLAELEIQKLRELLPAKHIIDIQHVGSTAIPNIMSKPVIDIQIAVDSLEKIRELAIKSLTAEGYIFWEKNPDPERLLFIKKIPKSEKRSHHVHIVEYKSKQWTDKILFRDYLRNHPKIAKEYERLKINLEKRYKYNREKYTEAKTDFIHRILKQL